MDTDAGDNSRTLRTWAVPVGVALWTFVVFAGSLRNGFLNWDDNRFFLDNPWFRGLGWSHIKWVFTNTREGFYPLSWLTYAFDYQIWGLDPFGYHLTTLVIHVANACVCYALIASLLRTRLSVSSADGERVFLLSCAVGSLFFAVHPLRVEAVAWATGRGRPLSVLFLMLSVQAYVRGRSLAGVGGTKRIGTALLLYAASLLSGPCGLMFPFVLVLLDVYPLQRLRSASTMQERRSVLLEKLPFVALSGVSVAMTLGARAQLRGHVLQLADYGLLRRCAQACYGVCFYVWKALAPFPLSPLYRLRHAFNPLSVPYMLCVVLAVGVTGLAVRLRHRWPWAAVAWGCYGVLILPVLGLVQSGPQIAADRYTYLACVPFALLVSLGVWRLCSGADAVMTPRRVRLVLSMACVALAVLSGLSLRQVRVWHDSETFWTHVLDLDAANHIAYNHRGAARHGRGDTAGALADYASALRLAPGYAEVLNNRGLLYEEQGQLATALSDYEEAIAAAPQRPSAYYNRGNLRKKRGDLSGAVEDYTSAIERGLDAYGVYHNRGNARAKCGDVAGAFADYATAIRLVPDSPVPYFGRGALHRAQGKWRAAADDFEKALDLAAVDWPHRVRTERLLQEARRKAR